MPLKNDCKFEQGPRPPGELPTAGTYHSQLVLLHESTEDKESEDT